MTDYEKAKATCWREYQAKGNFYPTARETFNWTFEQAYRYGRMVGMEEAKAQSVSTPDKFGNSEQLRAQVAIAAMHMLFTANPDSSQTIAKYAVGYADDLLAELDKTKYK